MSSDVGTEKRNLRPFTRRVRATGDGNIGGTTVVSLWNPAVPEGINEGNDYWDDAQVLILTGEMADQVREVTGFVQATGVITVAPRFVNPTVSLLTADSLIGDLVVDVADASIFPDSGSLLFADAPIGSPALVVVDASNLRAGFAVISDTTGASEAIVIVAIDPATNTLVLAAPLGATYTLDDEAAVSMGAAYIWDDTPDAEAVLILGIDETLNQLTIAFPGVVANYTVAQNAAISMSPTILDDVEFTLMPPTKTVDTGEHTNPEQWLHDNHWSTAAEVPLVLAGAPGELDLGAAVGAGVVRRIREVTVRHQGTANTVISILDQTGGNIILSIDVPAQSTRTWSSQDGRLVAAGLQPVVQTSDVTTAGANVSAAGVEK